jgi:hypothetical protein
MRTTSALVVGIGLALSLCSTAAGTADRPRYDVPAGYARCAKVTAWNGFFKWVSVRRATCRRARSFLGDYARRAGVGPMPRRLHGFRCAIRYWRNDEGDVYASRHRCVRDSAVIRFYGMV